MLRLLDVKRVRPLDAAVAVALILVVGLAAFLGYSVWANSQKVEASTPAGRAVEDLIASVKKNPNSIPLRLQLATSYLESGKRNEAIDQYQAVLKADKSNVIALAGLGIIALQDGENATAEGYFRKAVEILEPNSGQSRDNQIEEAYYYLGTALMNQKQYEDAAGYFKEALRLKRDSSMTHYLLAVCYRELGLKDAYRDSLGNCLLFDPMHPEANYDYGNILLAEGDRAGAAEHFRTSADNSPGTKLPLDALTKMGTVEEHISAARSLASKDRARALVEARIAVAVDPRSAEAFVVLGSLYEKADNDKKAKSAYQKALGVDAENKDAKAGLERVSK